MKYNALIYNLDNKNAIGQVQASSIEQLKHRARYYANNYNGKSRRVMIEDQHTGRIWFVNA